MDNFASLDTPGDPGGVKVVELSGMEPKSADSVTVNCSNIGLLTIFLVLVCVSCAVHAEFSSAQLRGDELQKMHDESIKKTTSSSS